MDKNPIDFEFYLVFSFLVLGIHGVIVFLNWAIFTQDGTDEGLRTSFLSGAIAAVEKDEDLDLSREARGVLRGLRFFLAEAFLILNLLTLMIYILHYALKGFRDIFRAITWSKRKLPKEYEDWKEEARRIYEEH